jgi:hypothetical protein
MWNFLPWNLWRFHELTLSTIGNERNSRSRCHCRYAAMRPEASRRFFNSLVSAPSQFPVNRSDIKVKVSMEGVALAEGLQLTHTEPPPTSEKYL